MYFTGGEVTAVSNDQTGRIIEKGFFLKYKFDPRLLKKIHRPEVERFTVDADGSVHIAQRVHGDAEV